MTRRADGLLVWTTKGTTFGLYLPSVSPGTQVPVVTYLHGCHSDFITLSTQPWIIQKLNSLQSTAIFLPIAKPLTGSEAGQCGDWGGTWNPDLNEGMLDMLGELDWAITKYNLNPNRQYLYGDSMGAEGTLMLLFKRPQRFSGAVATGATVADNSVGTSVGATEMARTPLFLVHGSADEIQPVARIRKLYQDILGVGGTRVQYREYPGLTHETIWDAAQNQANPSLCEWLLAQRR